MALFKDWIWSTEEEGFCFVFFIAVAWQHINVNITRKNILLL